MQFTDIPEHLSNSFSELETAFIKHFGVHPDLIVRAPGRVNLIGEHIDYCGYGVLPMALEQHIMLAVGRDDNCCLQLANVDSQYKSYTSKQLSALSIRGLFSKTSLPLWYKYFMCGMLGILERSGVDEFVGMKVLVHGSIPPSAGLSSSSALVCAAAVAVVMVNNFKMTKKEIAEVCQRSERYIGTEGGGMDQSISMLAEPSSAMYIKFRPSLSVEPVSLPEGIIFIVAHSRTELNKAASSHYNTRVAECRLAAKCLAKSLGLEWRNVATLCNVEELCHPDKSVPRLEEMIQLVKDRLHPDDYTRQEICQILDIPDEHLLRDCLGSNTGHLQSFRLYQRALHVFTEALRVLQFKQICQMPNTTSKGDADDDAVATALGKLMSASHKSCSQLYECSSAELDKLVQLASHVSLGSRLTGAGWGGCTVSLVSSQDQQKFMNSISSFYENECELQRSVFVSAPREGATAHRVQQTVPGKLNN